MIKKISLVVICLLTEMTLAEGILGPVTYGDLMIEDLPKELAGSHHAEFAAGYDVTNPYLNTYNFTLTYAFEISSLFDLGLEASEYSAQRSRYNDRLDKELQVFGVSAADDRPQASAFAIGRLRLLQGRVNLLGVRALPFRFQLKAGSGYLWHVDGPRTNCGTWGIESVLFLTSRWGLSLRFDQDLESLWSQGQTIYRNRLSAGADFAF